MLIHLLVLRSFIIIDVLFIIDQLCLLLWRAVAEWVRAPSLGSDKARRASSNPQCILVTSRTASGLKSQPPTLKASNCPLSLPIIVLFFVFLLSNTWKHSAPFHEHIDCCFLVYFASVFLFFFALLPSRLLTLYFVLVLVVF